MRGVKTRQLAPVKSGNLMMRLREMRAAWTYLRIQRLCGLSYTKYQDYCWIKRRQMEVAIDQCPLPCRQGKGYLEEDSASMGRASTAKYPVPWGLVPLDTLVSRVNASTRLHAVEVSPAPRKENIVPKEKSVVKKDGWGRRYAAHRGKRSWMRLVLLVEEREIYVLKKGKGNWTQVYLEWQLESIDFHEEHFSYQRRDEPVKREKETRKSNRLSLSSNIWYIISSSLSLSPVGQEILRSNL